MSGSSTCKHCGRPIVWAKTERGKNRPVDPDPVPNGDLELKATGTENGRVLFAVRTAPTSATKRWRCHFVSCPKERRPHDE
jgi:hypothetical protein